ncbi:MAG: hypothetical protein IJW16_01580 [Clostridia bacterium]|nr:hypothetical protein [Clostridia bacterium]
METVTLKEVHTVGTGVQVNMTARVQAISARYEKRGLVKAAEMEAEARERAEAQTAELAPVAYRKSTLSEAAVKGMYRRGKDYMDGQDLLGYFEETRQRRIAECDFSKETGIYETADPLRVEEHVPDTALVLAEEKRSLLPTSLPKMPAYIKDKLKTSVPEWFCGETVKSAKKTKKFPLSAFAAMIAVAVSLMLIVASSVMLTRAESRINALTLEADELSGEIAELRSDIDVESDLLYLREIAMEEYGMVDEEYVRMTYLNTAGEDSIEAFETEDRGGIGLSALLSAIGIGD